MESAIRGLVLDSSVLVAAERAKLTTPEVLRNIRATAEVGDAPIVISVMNVAELAHGIYRANTPERRERRRQFVDELKAQFPSIQSRKQQPRSSRGLVVNKQLKESICPSST